MNKKQIMKVSPLVGAVLLALSAPVAMAAAITAPAAGSLPGSFTSNHASTTYTVNAAGTGTIAAANATSPVVIQFGGATSAGTTIAAPNKTTTVNPGLDIGSGATLDINGSSAAALGNILINDESGNPSQIYGTIATNGGVPHLFIANANGIVVGATGTLPTTKTTLTSESQSSSAFGASTTGKIATGSTITGTGTITLATGASGTSAASTIIDSNGTVNLGVNATVNGNGTNTVNISGGTSALTVAPTLATVGDVNISGDATLTNGSDNILGTLTNSGVLTEGAAGSTLTAGAIVNNGQLKDASGAITATGIGSTAGSATITNNGVIDESGTAGLTLTALSGTTSLSGNVVNNGVINFTEAYVAGQNALTAEGANVDFGGTVNQNASTTSATATPTALSATNYLGALTLETNAATINAANPATGVVDVSSNLFASRAALTGQAVRVLSGDVTADAGNANVTVGADGVTDPFYKNAKLGYAFSLFGGTTVGSNGGRVYVAGPTTGTANINLDGVLGNAGTTSINVGGTTTPVNNINAGSAGGFSLLGAASSTTPNLTLNFTGNVNNPNGAAAAGSTAFQYNNVPVAVAAVAGHATYGVNLSLNPSGTVAQNVNLLVNGNVSNLAGTPSTAPLGVNGSTAVNTAAVNNHLVLQSTGNITTAGDYYWSGLLYMSTIAKASDPMVLSSGTSANGITLGGNLNNATAGNVTSGGGIFLETNSLNLGSFKVLTNTNSWVNFSSPAIASANYLINGADFYGSVINSSTPGVVNTQALPKSSFQG
jgi:hypothetical protein